MTAFDDLHEQCDRRGWRLGLAGSTPDGCLVVNALEVRGVRPDRELLASAVAAPDGLDDAAVDCARALERQGLIT